MDHPIKISLQEGKSTLDFVRGSEVSLVGDAEQVEQLLTIVLLLLEAVYTVYDDKARKQLLGNLSHALSILGGATAIEIARWRENEVRQTRLAGDYDPKNIFGDL
jgi:hypothetical protein